MNNKRILSEMKELNELLMTTPIDTHRFIEIIKNDDIYKIEICFLGPKDSPYEELINIINIELPIDYPHQAPKIYFKTKIFHPNIDENNGTICLDILKDKWRPIYTLRTILISIISLLSDPNPESPLNGLAASMYQNSLKSVVDRRKYIKRIISYDGIIN